MRPLESGGAGALAQERGGTRANAEHEREWEVEGDGLGEGVLEVVDGGGGNNVGGIIILFTKWPVIGQK